MLFEDSRYVGTPTFKNSDGVLMFSRRKKKTFDYNKCMLYQYTANDRLDTLSYLFYGHSKHWWQILDCNSKYMSELDIQVGDYIFIPLPSEVLNG